MATRQDVLFAAEDYIAKYQSFAQSNFQAYDFDNDQYTIDLGSHLYSERLYVFKI